MLADAVTMYNGNDTNKLDHKICKPNANHIKSNYSQMLLVYALDYCSLFQLDCQNSSCCVFEQLDQPFSTFPPSLTPSAFCISSPDGRFE